MTANATVTQVKLGPVQLEVFKLIRDPAGPRFFDAEGAIRSAKTWTVLLAIRTLLEDYPGITWTIARWNERDLLQKLLPDYRHVCELMGVSPGAWNAQEHCYDLDGGSRLYAVYLKAGQNDSRYARVRGLTTAGIYIDQLEEVPSDVYQESALRLSQPGFPQKLVVTPNAVPEAHWIAKRWPVLNPDADHRYLRLSIWDNRHNLAPETIAAAERLYPPGHPLRRTKLEGHRGLDVRGQAVYGGAFDRARHVAAESLPLLFDLPLCESYDYGFHHPCVIWYQYAPWGWIRVLGGVLGSDLHLDAFLPIVEKYRALWFPRRKRLDVTCDPVGANENAQGIRGTPVGVLADWYREHGEVDERGQSVVPTIRPDANQPERRAAAVEVVATYLRHQVNGQEAFLVDPERWVVAELNDEHQETYFATALEAGYVLEDTPRQSSRLGSYTLPRKDGYYEHPMNCLEYGVQAHVLDLPLSGHHADEATLKHDADRQREDLAALRRAQQDVEVDDRPVASRASWGRRMTGRGFRSRGGY